MNPNKIKIVAGSVEVKAKLNGSKIANMVMEAVPISGNASIWGDEIYFGTSITAEEDEDAVSVVDMGCVAYWPPGRAICLFFGPTPMSVGDEIRPASPVNVLGQIEGDPTVLKTVPPGASVTISYSEE